MYTKEVFLKSVYVCAIECIFFINIVKSLTIYDTLSLINLTPFDYWRLLNGFLKFDPQMPRALSAHFRSIEMKIVTESAWQNGSPIVEIIKELCRSPELNNQLAF